MNETAFFRDKFFQGLLTLERILSIEYHHHPRELLYQHDKIKLYHYQPKIKNPIPTPLLLVFSTVNRPEILDLSPEQSFIGALLENGLDVYLLDWGYPDVKDQHISFADYVIYLHGSIHFISEKANKNKINLLGICQGGVICLCYSALFNNLKNLILISTPVNFQTEDNLITNLINQVNITELIAMKGNVSGQWLRQFFISLRPFDLIGKKFLNFNENLSDSVKTEKFLLVEKWLNDAPDQPGLAFLELVKDFYQENKLIKGQIFLRGNRINLKDIAIPVLNIMALKDTIIPVSASVALKKYITSKNYSEYNILGGHIGIYLSTKTAHLAKKISNWIKKHDKK